MVRSHVDMLSFVSACVCMRVFQDEATQLVVFVLHSLKNQRESHMMGDSSDEELEQDISRVSCC